MIVIIHSLSVQSVVSILLSRIIASHVTTIITIQDSLLFYYPREQHLSYEHSGIISLDECAIDHFAGNKNEYIFCEATLALNHEI